MNTRERIIAAADQLFYEQGFEHTSFADVASAVEISRGNFYHHFKTKDDILEAVITLRLAKTQEMLELWEAEGSSPAERIQGFIQILIANRKSIMAHGCPVGTLCNELAKLDHDAHTEARKIFGLFRDWLAQQFAAGGRKRDATTLALHLLARSQGVATLANAFGDEAFIRAEVRDMCQWAEAQVANSGRAASPTSSPKAKKG